MRTLFHRTVFLENLVFSASPITVWLAFAPPTGLGCERKMRRWLLWLEGNGHRTCLAVQRQRLSENESFADSFELIGVLENAP